MLKWLFIGALCACYRLLLEEHVLAAVDELRDVLHLVKMRRKIRPAIAPRSSVDLFLGGLIAGLILLCWPVYIFVALGKLLGFTAGVKHKESKT